MVNEYNDFWSSVGQCWYSEAFDQASNVGQLYYHLAVFARPYTLEQTHWYTKALLWFYRRLPLFSVSLYYPLLRRQTSALPITLVTLPNDATYLSWKVLSIVRWSHLSFYPMLPLLCTCISSLLHGSKQHISFVIAVPLDCCISLMILLLNTPQKLNHVTIKSILIVRSQNLLHQYPRNPPAPPSELGVFEGFRDVACGMRKAVFEIIRCRRCS